MKSGIELISEERDRQISSEGWTTEHDDEHTDQSLSMAAACYASPIPIFKIKNRYEDNDGGVVQWADPWPWWNWDDGPRGGGLRPVSRAWDKRGKHSRLRQLVIAGALIAAEIDRLQRQEETEA